jgi:hypothetical protein
MKLNDLALIFLASVAGLVFSILSLLWKFFIENGVLVILAIYFIVLWAIKFAISFF